MRLFHTAHLRVNPAEVDRFKARIARHAHISVTLEPGCLQFDLHQERSDPSLFLLLESYADEAAFELHRTSAHYLAFRDDVKEWVIERNWWYWNPLAAADATPPPVA